MTAKTTTSGTAAKARKKAKPTAGYTLRWPLGMTLAPRVTTCVRCTTRPPVLAAVINGIDRHIDPLPLSATGLTAALSTGRVLFVANPGGPPMVHRATPGHGWITGYRADHRPLLLAEHHHDVPALDHDVQLAGGLLARFMPVSPVSVYDIDPPF